MSARERLALLAAVLGACVPADGGEPTTDAMEQTDTGSTTGTVDGTDASSGTTAATTGPDTTGTTGDASTGTEPASRCGDGILDAGEECDDGENNADYGPCTTACKQAVCGDGFVWAGVEACDLGEANGLEGSGCSADCEDLAHCGDGAVDPETEECDLEDLNGAPGSPCTQTCSLRGLIAFVTSETYPGELAPLDPEGLSGVAGADAACQELAAAAHLHDSERFMAWISAGPGTSPGERASSATTSTSETFVLVGDGTPVAEGWAGLTSGQLAHAINRTESGESVDGVWVWTNTTPSGQHASTQHCAGWSSTDGADWGTYGFTSATSAAWTEFGVEKCDFDLMRLYCIETPAGME